MSRVSPTRRAFDITVATAPVHPGDPACPTAGTDVFWFFPRGERPLLINVGILYRLFLPLCAEWGGLSQMRVEARAPQILHLRSQIKTP